MPITSTSHAELANAVRFLSIDAVEKAKSGHPGLPMGMADVATVLFRDFLRFDPKNPQWAARDRFVLSAGHGSMMLYALLYLTGYDSLTLADLKDFRQWGSRTAGHPEYNAPEGVETTTGPLGQGLATAVGMAIAERLHVARGGPQHRTYVIVSDGDLMEGISHEAMSLAGHLGLHQLIVLFDDNGISIDGPTTLTVSDNACQRAQALGWFTQAVDGHNPEAIAEAIRCAQAQSERPSFIACKTTIAYGAPTKAGTCQAHGSPLGAEEIAKTREFLKWPYEPFEIPNHILSAWRSFGQESSQSSCTIKSLDPIFDLDEKLDTCLEALKQHFFKEKPTYGTRIASQAALEKLTQVFPELIGGSADLTPSNNTCASQQKSIKRVDFSGSYIHYGIREHAMGAIMNGLSLHGPFIPYGGTFLVFSDYMRPAIRLSALMHRPVIYVMTHDSIGLGEDGPTHQPIEHLTSLRAIPNLNVFRPADAVEVAECWALAMASKTTPSLLALSRQSIIPVRQENTSEKENLCARGGYLLTQDKDRDLTLIATGSEVGLAMQIQKALQDTVGLRAAVVSMPCTRLFDEQPLSYQQEVLGDPGVLRVAIEAASSWGWRQYVGENGLIFGIDHFGASAPYQKIYEAVGLTVDHIVSEIMLRNKP